MMKVLEYEIFKEIFVGVCDCDSAEQYINENGYSEWTSLYFDGVYKYTKCIESIFELSRMDLKAIRKHLDLTSKEFSVLYAIPERTVQDWAYKENPFRIYIKMLICYTIFIKDFYNDTK